MSATDELRRLLNERGVEYTVVPENAYTREYIKIGNIEILTNDRDEVAVYYLTPEQAVEATLGKVDKVYAVGGIIAQAECRDVCSSVSEFTCSSCGFSCDLTSWISLFDGDVGRHRHHHHGTPNFCPNCGRKVVDA